MIALLKQKPETQVDDRITRDVKRWLLRDPTVDLASIMYIDDADDSRIKAGHSSPAYYVKKDERATFELVINGLSAKAENLFEMGVGSGEAVTDITLRTAKKIGASNVFAFDLSPALANNAVRIIGHNGLRAESVIRDIFEPLPLNKPNTLISLLGLTLGNIETYTNPRDVQKRLTQIFLNYADAVTAQYGHLRSIGPTSHLLISYDANRNVEQAKACYDNPEFENLVRSGVARRIGDTTEDFDYVVAVRQTQAMDFLSTGLRAKRSLVISYNGEEFPIEKDTFMPVLNSSRFSIVFITHAAAQADWAHRNIWSATGRVQYQQFDIR